MIRTRLWGALLLTLTLAVATPRLHANEIDGVTVFESRARVTRSQEANLTDGVNLIRFTGLTPHLLEESVSAKSATGDVLGVRFEWERHVEDVNARREAIREKLKEIVQRMTDVDRQLEIADKERQLITEYAQYLARAARERSATSGDDPSEILGADRQVGEWELAILQKLDELRRVRGEIGREYANEERNLARLDSPSARTTRTAVVMIAGSGATSVQLEYDVPGASWSPVYEARLDEAKKQVEWSYQAQVRQRSGEDWSGVRLTLSTVRSTLGMQAPQLIPVLVDSYERDNRGVMLGSDAAPERSVAPAPTEAAPPESEDLSGAIVRGGGEPVTFELRVAASVPSDGEAHIVSIHRAALTTELGFEAMPQQRPHVYRRGEITNSTQLPFLPGLVRVFREGAYVGDTTIPAVAPGESRKLYFGVEGRIVVRRVEVARRDEDAGAFSSDRIATIGARFDVENYLDTPATLWITDSRPVSEIEKVTVEITDATSPRPDEVAKNGLVRWKLPLTPGSPRKVLYEYQVRRPADVDIPLDWYE